MENDELEKRVSPSAAPSAESPATLVVPAHAVPTLAVPALSRGKDGRLSLARIGPDGTDETIPVRAAEAFPWSHRRRFVSLRDEKGAEVFSIDDLDAIAASGVGGAEAARLVDEDLGERMWAPRISKIHAIAERFEALHWKVDTDSGPRSFLTAKGEDPRLMPNGFIVIKDKGGDFLIIEKPDTLEPRSRALLRGLIDTDERS